MTKEEAAALTALSTGIGTTLAAILQELRRRNDQTEAFYTEVLDLLSRITEDPYDPKIGDGSPVGSGQPAAAPGCQVCGNTDINEGDECLFADLTRTEWLTHRQHFFESALSYRTEYGAGLYADQRMRLDFGPCPEES